MAFQSTIKTSADKPAKAKKTLKPKPKRGISKIFCVFIVHVHKIKLAKCNKKAITLPF
jgi:hypothetical protein